MIVVVMMTLEVFPGPIIFYIIISSTTHSVCHSTYFLHILSIIELSTNLTLFSRVIFLPLDLSMCFPVFSIEEKKSSIKLDVLLLSPSFFCLSAKSFLLMILFYRICCLSSIFLMVSFIN